MNDVRELRRLDITPCALCRRGVMHTGLPLCYAVSVERVGFDRRAIERAHGMELVAGSPAIAAVLGPDEALGKTLGPAIRVLVCEKCASEPHLLGRIQEFAASEAGAAAGALDGGA